MDWFFQALGVDVQCLLCFGELESLERREFYSMTSGLHSSGLVVVVVGLCHHMYYV